MKIYSADISLDELKNYGRVMTDEEVEEIGTAMAIADHEYYFFTSRVDHQKKKDESDTED